MLTVEEIIRRIQGLSEREIELMLHQVGRAPKCECIPCQYAWRVSVNRFLRAVEASRN